MRDLTKGNPIKLILFFAFPVLLGNIFQLLYSLVDTRIVGETLGEKALAAVGATNSVNTLIVGFLFGLTNGFAILVARQFGAKNEKQLKKCVAATFTLGILTSIVLTVVIVGFLPQILYLLNTPEKQFDQSYSYIRIIFLGMTISMLYNVCSAVLRAIGDTITPLVFLIISTVLNVFLDYMFIRDFNMGVAGAAYATLLAQSISAIACFIYMLVRYPILRVKKKDFQFEKDLILELYTTGLSMGLMSSLVQLGSVALQTSINTFGQATIVAHTAARKITELYMILFSVFGTTMATYCSQNLGAGKISRIKFGLRFVIFVTWIWCLGTVIASFTVAPVFIRMVTGSANKEIIHTATLYLKINTIFYFVPAVICIMRNALQGIGDRTTPIISSFIEMVGKVLVVIILTPHLKYMGIIVSEPIVWFIMVIPLLVKYFTSPVLKQPDLE